MQTRHLGRGGADSNQPVPRVSEIGLGGWALGGGWGTPDDDVSRRVIHAAIDAGINLIDTAPGYGDGHGERVIAAALAERDDREQVCVATKTPPADGPWPPSPYCRWQDRYSAAYLRENVEQRLSNLRCERLDLLQLHSWTSAWNDDPQPLLVLHRMREEGKIGLIGVCTPEQDQSCVIQLMRDGLVDVVQVIFNVFTQEPAAQILPVARETGTGVIVRVSLDEGMLTGKFEPGHQFAEGDFRRDYFAGDRLRRGIERVAAIRDDLRQIAGLEDYSEADVAIRFAMQHSAVSSVIVGMRTESQVQKNVRTASLRDLPDEAMMMLRQHDWRRGVWYSGK